MSVPSIGIRLSLEERPRLAVDYLTKGEEDRLVDWLSAKPEYLDLVTRAIELADQRSVA